MSDKKFITIKVERHQNREMNKSVIQLNVKKKINFITHTDSKEKNQILNNKIINNNNKFQEGKYILNLFIFILDTNNQIAMEKQLEIDFEATVKKLEVILNKKKKGWKMLQKLKTKKKLKE